MCSRLIGIIPADHRSVCYITRILVVVAGGNLKIRSFTAYVLRFPLNGDPCQFGQNRLCTAQGDPGNRIKAAVSAAGSEGIERVTLAL